MTRFRIEYAPFLNNPLQFTIVFLKAGSNF